MAEQALRAGRRVRTQPRRDIDRQDEAPVGGLRLRQHGQCLTQPVRVDAALVERVVQRAVPTPVLGQQRQIDRRGHRAVLTEHRVAELEQRVSAPGQTSVEVLPKVGGEVECLVPAIVMQQTHSPRPSLVKCLLGRSTGSGGGRVHVPRIPVRAITFGASFGQSGSQRDQAISSGPIWRRTVSCSPAATSPSMTLTIDCTPASRTMRPSQHHQ